MQYVPVLKSNALVLLIPLICAPYIDVIAYRISRI